MRRRGSILLTTILICSSLLTAVTILSYGARLRIRGEGSRERFFQAELDEQSVKILMEEYAVSCSLDTWNQTVESLSRRDVQLNKSFIQNEFINQFPKRSRALNSSNLQQVMEADDIGIQISRVYPIEFGEYSSKNHLALRMEYEASIKRGDRERRLLGAVMILLPLSELEDTFFDSFTFETNEQILEMLPEIVWKDKIRTVYVE